MRCVARVAVVRSIHGSGSGGIAMLYPYYLWHDTGAAGDRLFTFLATLAMALVVVTHRERRLLAALAAGFVLGLAILTRATLLPFALFTCFGWSCPMARERCSGVAR